MTRTMPHESVMLVDPEIEQKKGSSTSSAYPNPVTGGQSMSLAFYPRSGVVLYASEQAAVKAAVGAA